MSDERVGKPVLIGGLFCDREECQRLLRHLSRATVLMAADWEYARESPRGAALRQTRIGLIALRELLEAALGEEGW